MRTWRQKHQQVSYRPIDVETLLVDTYPPFDLFIKVEQWTSCFYHAGTIFDSGKRRELDAPRVEGVYIAVPDGARYQEYVEQNLPTIIASDNLTLQCRVGILYQVAVGLVEAVFADPQETAIISRSVRLAVRIASFLTSVPEAFAYFLAAAAHDYSAAAHSANVCFLSVVLGHHAGITEKPTLDDLSVGALLHDIGQTRISRYILRKRGPLTTAEYDLIKKAPWWGAEILAKSGVVRRDALIPVLQHQERLDGSGYPVGLRGNDIHLFGRICGLVEAYDAITSKHVYRDAQEGFPALMSMRSEADKFDLVLMETLVRLLAKQAEPTTSPIPARVG